MRTILFILILTFSGGCVSLPQEHEFSSAKSKPLAEMYRIKPGMSAAEVRAVLGDKLIIGYRQKDSNVAEFEPITIPQPYRQEEFLKGGHNYSVLFYNTSIVKPDGLIAEDELTPFIFEDGVLLAHGSDELDHLKRQ